MFYCDKTELAKAKKMNRKCREAGVIALDYDGRDSDMYVWSDTFYLYFPTKESLDAFAESDYFGFYAKHIGLYIIHNDHGAHLIPILLVLLPSLVICGLIGWKLAIAMEKRTKTS